MESLPDDVWYRILQIGLGTRRLSHVDLCSLAMVNSRFDQLTQDPTLWAILLSAQKFRLLYPSSQAPSKALYRKQKRGLELLIKELYDALLAFKYDKVMSELRLKLKMKPSKIVGQGLNIP